MEKRRLSVKGYVYVGIIVLCLIFSASIVYRLLTAEYPTHSDVFFMGVECGALAVVLLGCLFLVCLLLYHLVTLLYKRKSKTGQT